MELARNLDLQMQNDSKDAEVEGLQRQLEQLKALRAVSVIDTASICSESTDDISTG